MDIGGLGEKRTTAFPMPTYVYKAKSGPSEIIEGTITADSQNAVIARLTDQGYFPISIKEETEAGALGAHVKKKRVSQKDVGVFTRQLADLLEGGLTLFQALDTLTRQTENKTFSRVIQDIRDRVKEGNPLSDTLQNYPKIFNPLYVSMVRSGETGGMLDSVLVRLAEFSEKEQELRSRVRGALTYPFFLGSFGVITVGVLIVFVVPKLTGIFNDFGQTLPLPTRILMAVSHFMANWWWALAILLILAVGILNQQKKSAEGRFFLDRWKLRFPILGRLILTGEFARMSRTLSTLFESGVPVLKSLEIVTDTVLNEVVRRELVVIHEKISKGASLGISLEESKYFPLFMTNMVKVGEKGGALERALLKVADSYDREIDRVTRMFTTLLEPVLILTLGLVVGFIVVSMLLPIFNINLAVR